MEKAKAAKFTAVGVVTKPTARPALGGTEIARIPLLGETNLKELGAKRRNQGKKTVILYVLVERESQPVPASMQWRNGD